MSAVVYDGLKAVGAIPPGWVRSTQTFYFTYTDWVILGIAGVCDPNQPGPEANLLPYKPTGWSDKIVVSRTSGTMIDSASLTTADNLYIDWAIANTGNADAFGFYTALYVDGVFKNSWYSTTLNANYYASVIDYSIGKLTAGTHSVSITTDSTGIIAETNETDDSYSKTIVVNQPGPGSVLWRFSTNGWAFWTCTALGVDGTVFAASEDLMAINAGTGTELWRFHSPGGSVGHSDPAIAHDGTVYVGSGDYNLYALNSASGTKLWNFTTGGELTASPVISTDGTVFVGSRDHKVYALNGKTGTNLWKFTAAGIPLCLSVAADGTVFAGTASGEFYALNADTGAKIWEFHTATNWEFAPAAIGADGTIYVSAFYLSFSAPYDGRVYALDGKTGVKQWEFTAISTTSPVVSADGTVYSLSFGGILYALNGTNGVKLWQSSTNTVGLVSSPPTIGADNTIYVGTGAPLGNHKLCALDAKTGAKLWDTETDSQVISPIAISTNGTLYFGTELGYIYAMRSNSTNGLADGPWPKFHHDSANTGRATIITTQQPDPPTPVMPGTSTDTGYIVTTLSPTFAWTEAGGASRYGIYISHSPYGLANIVYSNVTLTGTSFQIPTGYLEDGTKYRWNMTSFSNDGTESDVSIILYFQTSAECPYADGYPYASSPFCPESTPSSQCPDNTKDLWGFFNRECTSYAAWKLNQAAGSSTSPYFFSNYMLGGHYGDAGGWATNAEAVGFAVNHVPAVGAIAQWNAGEPGGGASGHVAYVEGLNSDGTVAVSEYNYHLDHNFDLRCSVTPPRFLHIHDMSSAPAPSITPGVSGGALHTVVSGLSSGEHVVLEVSSDLKVWSAIRTNVISGTTLTFTNAINAGTRSQYFRVRLQ